MSLLTTTLNLLIYFIIAGRDYILALGRSFKERDTWNGNDEAMELKCINIYKDLMSL